MHNNTHGLRYNREWMLLTTYEQAWGRILPGAGYSMRKRVSSTDASVLSTIHNRWWNILIIFHLIWLYFCVEWNSVKKWCHDIKAENECKIMTVAYTDNTRITDRNCNCSSSSMEAFFRDTTGNNSTVQLFYLGNDVITINTHNPAL